VLTVLAGGVGAARFLLGAVEAIDAARVTAIVNVGDDAVIHGLDVSPDLDTVVYTLAGVIDERRGWGRSDESWRAIEQVRRYAESAGVDASAAVGNDAAGWFTLGDLDLGTHLYRSSRRRAGVPLSAVTAEIVRAWGVGVRVLPATDDPLRTWIETVDGRRLSFQEYFVREHHDVEIRAVHLSGSDEARPAPGVLDAIADAEVVVIAPSNPVVSIGPVLAVGGIAQAVSARREQVVAVSPIVGGAALKGPADRMLRELGCEPSVAGIAKWYAPLAGTLVIDTVDAHLASRVESEGVRCVVTDTVMDRPGVAAALTRACLEAGEDRSPG
jgi:LPPG:FO 2-phospho-L-lactate transferase